MKIGALSQATQTPVETIRYYEREGLLPDPPRSEGNYRMYSAVHAERLQFIRRCRSLDMTLHEIRTLLQAKAVPQADCADVNALLDAHLDHVHARIQELQDLARQLHALRAQCAGVQPASACGILQQLSQPSAPVASQAPVHVAGSHGLAAPRGWARGRSRTE